MPRRRSARDLHEPVLGSDDAAHGGQPAQVYVDLARPQVAAARHSHPGMTEAGHQRAHDLDGGPHALYQLVGRDVRAYFGGVDGEGGVRELDHGTQMLEHFLHGMHVLDVGHVVKHADARGQQRRGHELECGVLRPRHRHLARQPPPTPDHEARLCGVLEHSSRRVQRLSACSEPCEWPVAHDRDPLLPLPAPYPDGTSPASG